MAVVAAGVDVVAAGAAVEEDDVELSLELLLRKESMLKAARKEGAATIKTRERMAIFFTFKL